MKRLGLLFLVLIVCAPVNAATLLKQSTATSITLGPFLDETDGKTVEDGLTISQADLQFSKNGAAFAQKGHSVSASHDASGWYRLGLNSTDTGTLGRLMLMCHESGALPCWREFTVIPANIFDSWISGSDYLKTDATQVEGGDATGALDTACDTVTVTSMGTGVVTADAIAASAITSSEIADGAITDAKVANDVQVDVLTIETGDASDALDTAADTVTVTSMGSGVVTADAIATGAIGASEIAENALGASELGTDAVTEIWNATTRTLTAGTNLNDPSAATITDAVWDELLTGATHNIATSAGRRLRQIQEQQGYENGAIWIDSVNGTAGTEDFANGVVGNPVASWADALTLSASLGITRFRILAGTSITLSADSSGYVMLGYEWDLYLNGQTIDNMHICEAAVSGTGVVSSDAAHFRECQIGTVTLGKAIFKNCSFAGTSTFSGATTYVMDQCHAGNSPVFDFGAGVGSTLVMLQGWKGCIQVNNLGTTGDDELAMQGMGCLTLGSNCSTGTLSLAGNFILTDNISGGFTGTTNDDARIDVDQINVEADRALSDYDPPTKGELDSGLAGLNDPSAAEVWTATTRTLSANTNLNDPSAATIQAEVEEDGASVLDTLQDRLTASRAGYLDKLNVSGTLAHSDAASTYKADVTNLDAAVSSRSSHSAAEVWTATTRTLTGETSTAAILEKQDTILELIQTR